jgi:MerR family transcriptional regulator, mercuric resistance operon regulatory protein
MKTKGIAAVAGEKRSIGQLAKAAGVNVETVRYYHRRGLIPMPPKRIGGRRHYPESALRQIAFVRRAQGLGFTLEEIGSLLKILADGKGCDGGQALAQRKLEELDSRIAVLSRMKRELAAMLKKCDGADGAGSCAIVQAIDAETR